MLGCAFLFSSFCIKIGKFSYKKIQMCMYIMWVASSCHRSQCPRHVLLNFLFVKLR